MLLSPRLGTWIALVSAVIGLFAGLSAQGRWGQWMLFRNGGSFGVNGPGVQGRRRLLRLPVAVPALSARRRLHRGGAGPARRAGRALPLRRGAPAGHRGPDDQRRPGSPEHAGRRLRPAQGGRVRAGPAGHAAGVQRGRQALRRRLRRRERPAPGEGDPCLHRGRGGDRDHRVLQRGDAEPGLAGHLARPARRLGGGDRRHLPVGGADLRGEAERPGQGGAVHPAQHRGDPGRVRADRHEEHRRTRRATSSRRPAWPPTPRWCRTSGCSTRNWSPRRTPSSSRCAASTTSARSWTSTGTR